MIVCFNLQARTPSWRFSQMYHFVISSHYNVIQYNTNTFHISKPFVLALCEGNTPELLVDSLHKGPVMQHFDVFCDVSLNKLLNKQSICQWFKTPQCSCDICITKHYFTNVLLSYITYFDVPRNLDGWDSKQSVASHSISWQIIHWQIMDLACEVVQKLCHCHANGYMYMIE